MNNHQFLVLNLFLSPEKLPAIMSIFNIGFYFVFPAYAGFWLFSCISSSTSVVYIDLLIFKSPPDRFSVMNNSSLPTPTFYHQHLCHSVARVHTPSQTFSLFSPLLLLHCNLKHVWFLYLTLMMNAKVTFTMFLSKAAWPQIFLIFSIFILFAWKFFHSILHSSEVNSVTIWRQSIINWRSREECDPKAHTNYL